MEHNSRQVRLSPPSLNGLHSLGKGGLKTLHKIIKSLRTSLAVGKLSCLKIQENRRVETAPDVRHSDEYTESKIVSNYA